MLAVYNRYKKMYTFYNVQTAAVNTFQSCEEAKMQNWIQLRKKKICVSALQQLDC